MSRTPASITQADVAQQVSSCGQTAGERLQWFNPFDTFRQHLLDEPGFAPEVAPDRRYELAEFYAKAAVERWAQMVTEAKAKPAKRKRTPASISPAEIGRVVKAAKQAGAPAVSLSLPSGASFRFELQAELTGDKTLKAVEGDMEIVL
jgi:hypothetical protein